LAIKLLQSLACSSNTNSSFTTSNTTLLNTTEFLAEVRVHFLQVH
jgi:hypothetical protein